MSSLVKDPNDIKVAMLGMVEGNGHPYSWSAMFNGYDPEAMGTCPYACIPEYLNKQTPETIGIPGAKVTHIWTENPDDARHVAKTSLIPTVVDRPEDVIGQVDAVIIATDIGSEHVAKCRPFVEAGLPLLVDKPMVDNLDDLNVFRQWIREGHAIISGSNMRYCKELLPYRESTYNLGELRFILSTMPKKWETYGIHALEAILPVTGPGFVSCRNTGDYKRNVVHYKHRDNIDFVAATSYDMFGGGGVMQLIGTAGFAPVKLADSYYAFKMLLDNFVTYLKTGEKPFPYSETDELMKMLIAGIISREEGGREVLLSELD